jgi:DNA end-binding protein Ku
MPRAIWTGAISFGLVNVPVRMYSAIEEKTLHFNYVHEKDGGRIGYEKYCKAEDKPVPDDEVVKAYEVDEGEYVFLTDEDFEAAQVEGYKTIEITDFVPYEEIDPIYFERTYYLGPQEGAEKVYALLLRAMEKSGLAGVATYVLRDRQNLGCLRLRDGAIVLEKMFFADEIRPTDDVTPGKVKVADRELEMASELIDRFSGSFDPTKYEDTYRERLLEIIKAKQKGEDVHVEPVKEPEEPDDILDALRASLEASKARRGGARKRERRASERKPRDRKRSTRAKR